jgi:formiminotetrahydrofolate cyclodeaminase
MAENGKWSVAFWVVTVLTVASFGWTTFCFFHNSNKITDLAQTANHSLTAINENMSAINVRLSKIEWKLEAK